MTLRAEKALTEWRAVNNRLLLAKFKSKQCNISIIMCYAPTNDAPEEMKDEYHEELQILETLRGEELTINEEWCDIKNINQSVDRDVEGFKLKQKAVDEDIVFLDKTQGIEVNRDDISDLLDEQQMTKKLF
ncbi:uncharacterized protein [Palaemon carinicauda]|uniref:uncharacterized protein n=1 Tax=Palaemon carinicauda TaxID=392227 RepID=UPI0035B5FFB7